MQPLVVGMQNGAAALEDLQNFETCKTKNTLAIWFSSHFPCCLPIGTENLYPQKIAYKGLLKLHS